MVDMLNSTESTEGMKGKLKWNISQLSRERGIWKINSGGKLYEFYSSAHHDMWDGVVEAFDNLNKGDTVKFDSGPFSDRLRRTAMNIRVIDDVSQGPEAIERQEMGKEAVAEIMGIDETISYDTRLPEVIEAGDRAVHEVVDVVRLDIKKQK